MNKTFPRFAALLFAFSLLGRIDAQISQSEALKLRTDMATAVMDGAERADVAIVRLGGVKAVSGLNIDSGADLAFAAIDVGHRLLAKDRGAEAMQFFKAAEVALAVLAEKTPDSRAAEKAGYLQHLAFIRGHYLGKTGQAKLDVDQAILLQPDDKNVQRIKEWIGNAHGAVFNERPKANKKG